MGSRLLSRGRVVSVSTIVRCRSDSLHDQSREVRRRKSRASRAWAYGRSSAGARKQYDADHKIGGVNGNVPVLPDQRRGDAKLSFPGAERMAIVYRASSVKLEAGRKQGGKEGVWTTERKGPVVRGCLFGRCTTSFHFLLLVLLALALGWKYPRPCPYDCLGL